MDVNSARLCLRVDGYDVGIVNYGVPTVEGDRVADICVGADPPLFRHAKDELKLTLTGL